MARSLIARPLAPAPIAGKQLVLSISGYSSRLSKFARDDPRNILEALKNFVPDAGDSQIRAWRDSIKILQGACDELCSSGVHSDCAVFLEYTIPLESRRIDALLLLDGSVLVLEFKGKHKAYQSDVDQAAAYGRDLSAYHAACANISVQCLLILTGAAGNFGESSGVKVIGHDCIVSSCLSLIEVGSQPPDLVSFEREDIYQPLPSLIKAARELFRSGELTRIHRAAAATEPTLDRCAEIVAGAANEKRRALILISGVPGAGKTLVGLTFAHAQYLQDFASVRASGEKPTAPAVFLSGNGPLVEVLQYELRSAGGDGKAFVRGVHEYVKTFTRKADLVPPQHVLIYDEAQRAFDAAQVAEKQKGMKPEFEGMSEPELFVRFAEHIPDWCVVVGLIGTGQEIHIGEEGGIGQWASAIKNSVQPDKWDIFIPDVDDVVATFSSTNNLSIIGELQLSQTIRFHLATRLYDFVEALLDGNVSQANRISHDLEQSGYQFRLTHDLQLAKTYLTDRYDKSPEARFGLIASSRDKELKDYGVPKGFKSPFEAGPGKFGKWYAEPLGVEGSCTNLDVVVTEFGAQGLELDASLLAWGTDLIRQDGEWTNHLASKYRDAHRIKDAKALRINAYRVLLTRGRDACVVYVPPIKDKMEETYRYLRDCGFTELEDHS